MGEILLAICVCMSARAYVCVWILLYKRHVSVGVCVILTNPSDMNEWRQTGGFGSHDNSQGLLQGMHIYNNQPNPALVLISYTTVCMR